MRAILLACLVAASFAPTAAACCPDFSAYCAEGVGCVDWGNRSPTQWCVVAVVGADPVSYGFEQCTPDPVIRDPPPSKLP